MKDPKLFALGALLAVAAVGLLKAECVQAAHSRTRFVASSRGKEPTYDRSITTFSSEGRLLQVEYGMEASLRGSTAAAIQCDNDTLLLVVKSSPGNHKHSNSNNKVYRIDDHVFLVVAGLVGDARFMADQLRQFCQSVRANYGEAPTLRDVAEQAADWQHTLTRMEGARPLACTCIVVGVDPAASEDQLGPTRIFRSGPGGSLEEYRYCAAGKGQDQVMKALAAEVEKRKESSKTKTNDTNGSTQKLAPFAKAAMNSFDLKNEETVDVWTIRPHLHRRGKMHATCFQGVTKTNIHQIDLATD